MTFIDSDNDIKLWALEASHYCPPYKEDTFIEHFNLDKFDVDDAKDQVRKSVALLSHNKPYRGYILEILDILDQNKYDFLIDQHKYISFYWSGIPVLQFEINSDIKHNKQLHISLQKYKTEKNEKMSDKKINKLIIFGLAASLILGSIVTGLTFYNRNNV